jgi:hypothetical protein
MNNRNLLIVFISCLVLFLAGKFFRGNKSSSFDPVIVTVDTAKVDRIKFISPGPDKKEFELKREGNMWQAIQGETSVKAETKPVTGILAALTMLNAERVVTKDQSKYPEYELDDAKAARFTAWAGDKQVADLAVGGFRFDQAAQTASSFIKKTDAPEVYIVNGFAGMGLKARFDQFRDKKLVHSDAAQLTSIEWTNAAGRKQVIQKEDGAWYYAGMEAVDSAAFSTYLAGLVNATGASFSDRTSTQGLTLVETLTLKGTDMPQPTIISSFQSQDTLRPFRIHSTDNPQAIFTSDTTGIYKKVFADLRKFWPDGQ